MSIAEQLIRRGRQEGWQEDRQEGWQEGERTGLAKGSLVGRIEMCQRILHRPISPASELERKDVAELEGMLRGLEAELGWHAG